MDAAQRDFSGDCAAEWVRATNAAWHVRPATVANFPRTTARLARQATSVMAFARRARRAVLPVATKFHGAFCMGAAQRDFSGACTAEWVRAKNAARRVRPAAVANFPRAESAIGTAGGASSAPVSPNFPRAESAFASGKDYGFRASRAAGYLPVATKFHDAVLHGRGATGFSRRLRSGVGASEAPLCREGKRTGPERVWKRKKPAMAGDVPPVSAKNAQASWRKVRNLQRHNGAKNAEIAIQESFKHTPAWP